MSYAYLLIGLYTMNQIIFNDYVVMKEYSTNWRTMSSLKNVSENKKYPKSPYKSQLSRHLVESLDQIVKRLETRRQSNKTPTTGQKSFN